MPLWALQGCGHVLCHVFCSKEILYVQLHKVDTDMTWKPLQSKFLEDQSEFLEDQSIREAPRKIWYDTIYNIWNSADDSLHAIRMISTSIRTYVFVSLNIASVYMFVW